MKNRLWTISNMLSVSRILLMAPVAAFLLSSMDHNREYATMFIILAVVTDALDGYFARLLHQESEVGRIVDPLADKIGVGIVVVLLLFFGDIPLWFALLVLGRDIIIFLGGVYIRQKKGVILPSNLPGKFAVSLVALTLVLALLRYPMLEPAKLFSLWLSILLLIVSFVVYVRRFFATLKLPSADGSRTLDS